MHRIIELTQLVGFRPGCWNLLGTLIQHHSCEVGAVFPTWKMVKPRHEGQVCEQGSGAHLASLIIAVYTVHPPLYKQEALNFS